jgi:hypothetical protein
MASYEDEDGWYFPDDEMFGVDADNSGSWE